MSEEYKMLGVALATVTSLIEDGELGSKKIGDVHRVFLSDLEAYLGEERAHSLVREINRDEGGAKSGTSQGGTPQGNTEERSATGGTVYEMELPDGSGYSHTQPYEPVAQKWSEIDKEEEAILLADLSEKDVQTIRTLMYRRVGKENVVVRAVEQHDHTFKAIVRARKGSEYLKE